MKKTTLISFLFIMLSWISNTPFLYAVDVLTSFRTTISRLEISKDGGATWITIFDGSSVSVDLVTLSGQGVGTFLGEADIPAGVYNRARVRISTATLVFTVDGTGISGATNLSAGTTGTLTIDLTTTPGAPTFPLTRTQTISVSCKHSATTEATIDFDAQTSFSGLSYTDDDGAGAGVAVTLAGITFEPVVTVAN